MSFIVPKSEAAVHEFPGIRIREFGSIGEIDAATAEWLYDANYPDESHLAVNRDSDAVVFVVSGIGSVVLGGELDVDDTVITEIEAGTTVLIPRDQPYAFVGKKGLELFMSYNPPYEQNRSELV